MNDSDLRSQRLHKRSLDLAATAIDYELTGAERAEFEGHLATCLPCSRRAAAMRADALALGLPSILQPSRRVDDAVHAEIARPHARSTRVVLLVAAALLLGVILGALAVGAYLLREPSPLRTTVVPAPTATPIATHVTPPPSAAATASATARPDPTAFPASFPLPTSAEVVYELGEGTTRRSINADTIGGAGIREIAPGQDPSFLWDSNQIVYACTDAQHQPEMVGICLVAISGGAPYRVIDDPTARTPQWEPGGGTRARFTFNNGTIDLGEAWIADKDGSSARQLAAGGAPAWSADGLWLVYQPEGPTPQVAIIRPDGSGKRIVSRGWDAAWSRDGARLVFASLEVDGSLAVASADTPAAPKRLVFTTASTVSHPSWLDGDGIVFWMDGDVWRLDAGTAVELGVAPMRLTTGLGITEGAPLSVSPDGRWLLFASPNLPTAQIYVVSIDGGWAPARIAPGTVTKPIWRPEPVSAP